MSQYVDARTLDIHPAIPYDQVRPIRVLGNAHGVHFAAATVILRASEMGVRVGKDDVDAAGVDASAGAWPLAPIIIPASDSFNGKRVLVAVVFFGGATTVERAVAVFVKRRSELVPVFAQALIAAVFHGPKRNAGAFVDVEHLAAVFGNLAAEHFASSDGPATVGIELVAQGLHLADVLFADAFVAGLVEENAGIVAIADTRTSHEIEPLLPPAARHVALGITRGHPLAQTDAVAGFDILFPRSDMHPADQVGVIFHHKLVAEVAQPGRDGQA